MKKGFIAGNFDVIHPGYIKMFKECRNNCDHFTVLLQSDPSIERPEKLNPILSIEERIEQLESNRFIDNILTYTLESELLSLIIKNKFDVRFLGDDYKDKDYTGKDLDLKIIWIDRNHSYSTTRLKKLIKDNE